MEAEETIKKASKIYITNSSFFFINENEKSNFVKKKARITKDNQKNENHTHSNVLKLYMMEKSYFFIF